MSELAPRQGSVSVSHVNYSVGEKTILDDMSLDVEAGSFVSMVGASGAGKSSLLRVIGGHVRPDSGAVTIGGKDMTRLDAQHRPTATVFQSHALFPNMTVFENVAFGLRVRGWSKARIVSQVGRMLDLVGLGGMGARHVIELSGGESQRVATARALAVEPDVILMDEPLAALDEKIKERLRIDLKELFKELGVTTIYVTHDQNEALVLSDKVVVMGHSQILQVGTPEEVYLAPISAEVADFVGSANIIGSDVLQSSGSSVRVSANGYTFDARGAAASHTALHVAVRQEDLMLDDSAAGQGWDAEIEIVQYRGASTRYGVKIDGFGTKRFFSTTPGTPRWQAGDHVSATVASAVVLDGSAQ